MLPTKFVYTNPNPNAPEASERHALIDGSLFAGTITRRAYTAAQKLAPPDAEIVVVHLGTGNQKASITPEEYNKMTPIGLVMRAFGWDPMQRKLDPQATTYWLPRQQVTDVKRYYRQF